ncbi:hypothetical protein EDI_219200 [Entamoeba dispar SAW760]|uniref:Uncharacterized protein n=1 Tax=Entamoeba dispar (strain ATCC PRA-260 / SAW760) TaxID=370354 RepID=B0EQ78_ENTDS|nr:uncharacterized protein EDI_219200 [Entamoeba dispar SAW760]EDR23301.1 hypothetical protein EDI_219200 [Entamoeba dispar SAW760]|eukprot:EDR23301.1 hypothetical protein EDI_219200 [Entamoeba dispar SAW760]
MNKCRLENLFLRNVLFYLPNLYEIMKFESVSKSCQIAIVSVYIHPYQLTKKYPFQTIIKIFPKLQTIYFNQPHVIPKRVELKNIDNFEIECWNEHLGFGIFSKKWFGNKVRSIHVNKMIANIISLSNINYTKLQKVIVDSSVTVELIHSIINIESVQRIICYLNDESSFELLCGIVQTNNEERKKTCHSVISISIVFHSICNENIIGSLLNKKPTNMSIALFGKKLWNDLSQHIICFPSQNICRYRISPTPVEIYDSVQFKLIDPVINHIITENISRAEILFSNKTRQRKNDFSNLINLKTLIIDLATSDIILPTSLIQLSLSRCKCFIQFGSSQLTRFILDNCECKGTLDISCITTLKVLNDKSHFNFIKNETNYKRELPIDLTTLISLHLPDRWFVSRKVVLQINNISICYPTFVIIQIEKGEMSFRGIGREPITIHMEKFNFYNLNLKETINIKEFIVGDITGTLIINRENKNCNFICRYVHYYEGEHHLKSFHYEKTDERNVI